MRQMEDLHAAGGGEPAQIEQPEEKIASSESEAAYTAFFTALSEERDAVANEHVRYHTKSGYKQSKVAEAEERFYATVKATAESLDSDTLKKVVSEMRKRANAHMQTKEPGEVNFKDEQTIAEISTLGTLQRVWQNRLKELSA